MQRSGIEDLAKGPAEDPRFRYAASRLHPRYIDAVQETNLLALARTAGVAGG